MDSRPRKMYANELEKQFRVQYYSRTVSIEFVAEMVQRTTDTAPACLML